MGAPTLTGGSGLVLWLSSMRALLAQSAMLGRSSLADLMLMRT